MAARERTLHFLRAHEAIALLPTNMERRALHVHERGPRGGANLPQELRKKTFSSGERWIYSRFYRVAAS